MPATFYEYWSAYPKRLGANPRALAEQKFAKAIKSGADPEHLISSVKKYADELKEQNLINTPYVCHAATWINQRRWLDYKPDHGGERNAQLDADMAKRGYVWKDERWQKINGSI